ncbi:MAG: polysaccharide pyruvyl transferase family protein [Sphingomonadaceae bacterium]|nr:polysaccharide pyruvyl transferase family protein [Sphingomonadaceae bacterium]
MSTAPATTADRRRVVLITKTATQNQGNQALSIVWRDFLARRYPEAEVRLVERAPAYLKRYTLAAIARQRDPVAAFDALAASLVARMPRSATADPSVWNVRHDPDQQQVIRFLKLRQALRLRGRLARIGVGEAAYLERLSYICGARLVVVNPAGEFQANATDTPLHYLLETRCAQLSGASTAFVNLSFEVADPVLARLSDHVFRHCDLSEFRDTESLEHLRATGGTAEPLILPDGAIMSAIARPESGGGKGLALAINALQVREHALAEKWDAMVDQLLTAGLVTLTSNEWTTDFPFWHKYLERDGVTCEGSDLPYDEYARLLVGYDVVVSSRLHTCVLGLVAGAAIVPVETGTFKLSGFFNMIGMADEPVRMDSAGWQDRLLERIAAVRSDRAARIAMQDRHVDAARARFEQELTAAFTDRLAD